MIDQFHDVNTEVLLTKEDTVFGGEILIARFRLFLEAKAAAVALTTLRPDLRLFITGTGSRAPIRFIYEGGEDITDAVSMAAGGPFPIVGETAA